MNNWVDVARRRGARKQRTSQSGIAEEHVRRPRDRKVCAVREGQGERTDVLIILENLHKYSNRNRRASDDLQAYQRDRQTQEVSSSSAHLAIFLFCIVFQERMVQVAITGLFTISRTSGATRRCSARNAGSRRRRRRSRREHFSPLAWGHASASVCLSPRWKRVCCWRRSCSNTRRKLSRAFRLCLCRALPCAQNMG
jgi:hypothetical protein